MTTFVDQTTLLTATFMNAVAAVIESASVSALSLATPAADTIPYFTSASAATVASLTPFARTLLDDVDAAAMRTTLGLATIGGDIELNAIAELTSAANKLPYFTGSGTAALADFTAFARTLLDDTSGASMLATLGAQPTANPTFTGTVHLPATQMDNNSLTEAKTVTFNGVIETGASGSTKIIDWGMGCYQKVTMTADCTFSFVAPSGPCCLHLSIDQDGTGGRTWVLPASVKWPAAVSAGQKTLSTAVSSRNELVLKYNGTDYIASLLQDVS